MNSSTGSQSCKTDKKRSPLNSFFGLWPLGVCCTVHTDSSRSLQGQDWLGRRTPQSHLTKVQRLKKLPHLAALKIPKSCGLWNLSDAVQWKLLSFSDASFIGYDACTYLWLIGESGQISGSHVIRKAKVAPTKVPTIPRLKLSLAVTAVRIMLLNEMIKRLVSS